MSHPNSNPGLDSSAGLALRPVAHIVRPASIAIVGASADPRSFGGFVLGNLRRFGYPGRIHPVSRSSESIEGLACVRSVSDLPEGVDLAVLAIPEAGVPDAVRALGERGCRSAVLFASGYAETGAAGRERQHSLAAIAAAGGVDLVGPNCMGFTNYVDRVPLTFEPIEPVATAASAGRPGVGVLAQSGAMAANLRDAFIGRGVPVSTVFSTGNEVSVGIEDVLAHFVADDATRVVAVYAEQIRRPASFLRLARRACAAGKPVVLLMPGRSERARAGAASHTGALAGDHASALAMLRREAVLCVDTLDELFDTTAILARHPAPPAGGLAFMTGSGAMKNVALDLCADLGLETPALDVATVARLRDMLPAFAVAENPLDYTTIGVRQPGLIGEIVDTLLADDAIGHLVLCIPAGPAVAQRDKVEHILPALARAAKPTLLVVTGDEGPIEPFFVEAIRASGVPFQRSLDRTLRALARIGDYELARRRAVRAPDVPPAVVRLPSPAPGSGVYPEYQGKAWLAAMGVAVPAGALARELDEALAIARRIGWPVVLKAQASALPHKSDAGGVIVGVADEAALRTAWSTLHANVSARRPGLVLDGVLVEAMGAPGLELVVGARRDPDWGPVVLVGLGGVWIEALKDVRLVAPDVDDTTVVAELRRLKAAPLLDGVRGAPPVDLAAIARVVVRVAAQMRANDAIVEVDVNPLVAYPGGAVALDALVACRPESA